ncbi:MAG: hypothetical protein JXR19_07245 [Bacteroidia bacterium]
MKRLTNLLILCACILFANAQDIKLKDVNSSNTWFKLGLNAGVPVADVADVSSFALGVDLSVQYLPTKAYGYGLKAGYTNYFGKDPAEDFSAIPLAVLFRFYPESTGFFAGAEVGYAFLNNVAGTSGGWTYRPHIGWHTDNWNFFGYFDHIMTEENVSDIQTVGLGVTRNVRF